MFCYSIKMQNYQVSSLYINLNSKAFRNKTTSLIIIIFLRIFIVMGVQMDTNILVINFVLIVIYPIKPF